MQKNDSPVKLFIMYLHSLRYSLLCALLCMTAFALVFFLYDINMGAVWYPALLSVFFLLVFIVLGFIRFYKKHMILESIKNELSVICDRLPTAGNLIESDYSELTASLEKLIRFESDRHQAGKNELSDYYSAWMHQIKTPISAMRVLLQQEDTEINSELSNELFYIEQYVEMALYYIRLGENASDLLIKEYPLDSIIRRAIRKYAAQFVRRRIQLVYEGTDKTAITDEKWLSFIIEQLLSNAVKYTKKGVVKISVSDEKILKISDNGIGIAPEDLPRIFEKGFTGYNGRLDKKSTGIGLYLCKIAAGKLSHKLSCTSELDKGSEFCVDLSSYKLTVE